MAGFLEQIMGGGGEAAAAPADLPPSMPDPEAGAAPAPAGGTDEVGTLKSLLGLANDYMGIGSVTEQEKAQMQQVTSIVQKLLASNEQMSQKTSGATPELQKALAGGI